MKPSVRLLAILLAGLFVLSALIGILYPLLFSV